jgi:hypothetical protein
MFDPGSPKTAREALQILGCILAGKYTPAIDALHAVLFEQEEILRQTQQHDALCEVISALETSQAAFLGGDDVDREEDPVAYHFQALSMLIED